jgi:hypothetical protein
MQNLIEKYRQKYRQKQLCLAILITSDTRYSNDGDTTTEISMAYFATIKKLITTSTLLALLTTTDTSFILPRGLKRG